MISRNFSDVSRFCVIVFFSTFFLQGLFAQGSDVRYTQYMYSYMNVNPSLAGSTGRVGVNSYTRAQWLGIEGAPVIQSIQASVPILYRMGMGVTATYESIGPVTNTDIDLAFSYMIRLTRKSNLSFGASVNVNMFSIDYSKLNFYNFDLSKSQSTAYLHPNMGFGVFYQKPRMYVGLSVQKVLLNLPGNFVVPSKISLSPSSFAWYFMGGYVFTMNRKWKFKPATVIRYSAVEPFSADLSANFIYKKKFGGGINYQIGYALGILLNTNVNENFTIGVGFEKNLTDIGSFSIGSFELFLRYTFDKRRRNRYRIVSPRYF